MHPHASAATAVHAEPRTRRLDSIRRRLNQTVNDAPEDTLGFLDHANPNDVPRETIRDEAYLPRNTAHAVSAVSKRTDSRGVQLVHKEVKAAFRRQSVRRLEDDSKDGRVAGSEPDARLGRFSTAAQMNGRPPPGFRGHPAGNR
jgi:hypothetical protein